MVTLFVEGGGDHNDTLKTECRRGFSKLLEKAGFSGRMPRIVACGGRNSAYESFCTAVAGLKSGDVAVLLVDAEEQVTTSSPWEHVKQRSGDGWARPGGVSDDHLHLMVQCMEAWFLADREAMRRFFGTELGENALPKLTAKIEEVPKRTLYEKLKAATKGTKTKGAYGKGEHSFKLLATLDPAQIRAQSQWANRFFATMDRVVTPTL